MVFTWESTGATGLTYKCSLNGDTQFDCEFIHYMHTVKQYQYYSVAVIVASHPPFLFSPLLLLHAGSSPYEVPIASLKQGENVFEVSAFLSDGQAAGSLQITVTVGASKLCQHSVGYHCIPHTSYSFSSASPPVSIQISGQGLLQPSQE